MTTVTRDLLRACEFGYANSSSDGPDLLRHAAAFLKVDGFETTPRCLRAKADLEEAAIKRARHEGLNRPQTATGGSMEWTQCPRCMGTGEKGIPATLEEPPDFEACLLCQGRGFIDADLALIYKWFSPMSRVPLRLSEAFEAIARRVNSVEADQETDADINKAQTEAPF